MSSDSIRSKCWQCEFDKDPNWMCCPNCGARLKDTRVPSPPKPTIDISFLYDLYSFGWDNHHVAAVALYETGAEIQHLYVPETRELFRLEVAPPCAQQILRAKIFAEYVALLEVFGVLCLAITKRSQQSMMWTYLNTEPQEVAQFYDRILSTGAKSLQKLLKLPSLSSVKKAMATGFNTPIAGLPDDAGQLDIEHVIYDYREHSKNIVQIARSYRESPNVRIYNKIKHVFSMVNGRNWLYPPLDPGYVAFAINDEGLTARLPMKSEAVEEEINQIRLVTITAAELMALCLFLYRLGVL
jgi:hypothetical protein